MKLHIFNPEHDMALASGKGFFTPPHAARKLRADLGFIPALWADDGDMVLVDDVEAAIESVRHVKAFSAEVLFVTLADLQSLTKKDIEQLAICPWGWDVAIIRQLTVANDAFVHVIPDTGLVDKIKRMSNRKFASENLLPYLRSLDDVFVGRSSYHTDLQSVERDIEANVRNVLKAPWSSSGRGLRYVEYSLEEPVTGWCRNVISRQGGLMVEPYYNKVLDFGMEFFAGDDNRVEYAGLSLFKTVNGAYAGSIIAAESEKMNMVSRYVSPCIIEKIKSGVVERMPYILNGGYVGPFGIDLMVVSGISDSGFLIHPCVELNLRRTMGHVALSLPSGKTEPQRLMTIRYDGKYHLRISNTNENLLNTSLAV